MSLIFYRLKSSDSKKKRKAFFSLFLIFSLFFTNLISEVHVQAEGTWPAGIDIASDAAIVMDEDTGTVLYAKNENDVHYPASITKVMTALLAVENGNMSDIVTYSQDAIYKVERGSSGIARDVGEQMTLEQCLYAMLLESCNSSAYAIAEHIGGTYDNFIKMMNDKAKELGCKNTHFNNANGLPDENHYTSCYDMALIAREAYKNKTFRTITGTRTYSIPPTNKHSEVTPLNNHHEMLHYYKTSKYLYDYCVGGKTGYTTQANSTLVTYAKKDNMTLVCVVMNSQSPNHYLDTTNLFNYCFDNFQVLSVKDNAPIYKNDSDFDLGELASEKNNIEISSDGTVIIPKAVNFSELSYSVVPKKDKEDSSSDNTVLGTIEYTYADRNVGSADLIAENTDNTEPEYPFHDTVSGKNNDGKYFRIDIRIIILIAVLIILIIAFVFVLKKKNNTMNVKPVKSRKHHKSAKNNSFLTGKRIPKKKRRRRKKRNNAHDLTKSNPNSENYVKIKRD